MNEKHYKEKLSAFVNHELANDERQTVGEHLLQCADCRAEHDVIKFGATLAGNLKQTDAPENLWLKIEKRLDEKPKKSFVFLRPPILIPASFAVLIVCVVWFSVYSDFSDKTVQIQTSPKESLSNKWSVETISGMPKTNNRAIADTGVLAIGETLITDENSKALVKVAEIGQVEIAPNSRVQLVNTSANEHRLSLEKGILQAKIIAPPRLFIVDTPSAVAVDLGCAYTLEVDENGDSRLHVTSGFVALEKDGRESIVPAGAMAITKKDKGIGTPFAENASAEYRAALYKFDFENGGSEALKTILKNPNIKTSLTLWHLLSRVPETERQEIFNILSKLVKPPANVTREGISRLNKEMLDAWWKEIETAWFN